MRNVVLALKLLCMDGWLSWGSALASYGSTLEFESIQTSVKNHKWATLAKDDRHSIAGHKNIQSNLHNFSAVLWIRIGYNADPDPAFYLNADLDPGRQTKAADLCRSGSESSARIFKRLWSPGIDSKASIPPAYVAWRAGTITLLLLAH